MSAAGDRMRVRRAARTVGVLVGIASAAAIAAGVGILVAVIVLTSRREGDHDGGRPGPGVDDVVVDAHRILPWVLVLGVLGVVVMAFVAWAAARRAVRPLASALALQRGFVADASHELRTPLTTLSSRVQLLQRRRARGEPIDDTVQELRADVDAMAALLDDMLLTAEGAQAGPADASCALAEAADAARSRLAPLLAEADVDVEIVGDARARLAPVTAERVLVALIDNALQHSPGAGVVRVAIGTEDRFAAVRVSDHGGGIRGIDPERVFDRFARSGETGRRRGYGLGLALVRDVATRAGGSVRVERTGPEGTTFLLRLPRE